MLVVVAERGRPKQPLVLTDEERAAFEKTGEKQIELGCSRSDSLILGGDFPSSLSKAFLRDSDFFRSPVQPCRMDSGGEGFRQMGKRLLTKGTASAVP